MTFSRTPAIFESFDIISLVIARAKARDPLAPMSVVKLDRHKKQVDIYRIGEMEVLRVTTRLRGEKFTTTFEITRPL